MEPPMDRVFRALGDPSRRVLLDALFDRDGQTLGELCAALPVMTRFGVMKHLEVLVAAGLVTTTRHGREKLHYLNPVPIRLIHDRWIAKYAQPHVEALVGLRRAVERGPVAEALVPTVRPRTGGIRPASADPRGRGSDRAGAGPGDAGR